MVRVLVKPQRQRLRKCRFRAVIMTFFHPGHTLCMKRVPLYRGLSVPACQETRHWMNHRLKAVFGRRDVLCPTARYPNGIFEPFDETVFFWKSERALTYQWL